MIRIIAERSTGKTARLMLLAKENNSVFICSNPHAMNEKAKAYGFVGIPFISYSEALNLSDEYRGRTFVVDELEQFAKVALNENIVAYSLSKN